MEFFWNSQTFWKLFSYPFLCAPAQRLNLSNINKIFVQSFDFDDETGIFIDEILSLSFLVLRCLAIDDFCLLWICLRIFSRFNGFLNGISLFVHLDVFVYPFKG